MQDIFAIHRQLAALVLEGGDLNRLAHLLANLIQRAVTIETPELHLLAHAEHGQIDAARENSILQAQTPAKLRQFLERRGLLEHLRRAREPVILAPEPEAGMTMQRVVAPIIVGNEPYGYVWIIAGDRRIDEVDTLAIESAAIVAALIMLRDRVVRDSEERLRAELLAHLLHDNLESVQPLLHHLVRLGLDLAKPSQVLVCTQTTEMGLEMTNDLRQHVLDLMLHLTLPNLVTVEGNRVVALFSASRQGHHGRQLAEALLARFPQLLIGLSDLCYTVSDIQHGFVQMRDALDIAMRLGTKHPIITPRDIGYLNILSKVPREAALANPYYQLVLSLASYDEEHHSELLATLEAYLECGGNISHTASTLFLHRGTIHYRLKRIEELIQLDLTNPLVWLNLFVALKLYRLRHSLDG